MSGCLIPHTPLAVDFWKRRNLQQTKLFFLSHMHSDHTEGLSSSWNQTIYCSEITKGLAIAKFNINPSLLVVLPTGQSTMIDLDEEGIEKLTVTTIDANHCPGAVMFLFEGYFGKILCTGDFRYFDGMLDIPPLSSSPSINQLYLDNTYCDPECEFPTKAEATLTILNIIQSHPNKDVVFGLDSLGKEDLLYKVALVLGVRIVIDEFRFQTTKLLGISSVFTTEVGASRIRVLRKHLVTNYNIYNMNNQQPTIAILPTCLYKVTSKPFQGTKAIFVVPYSDHSSFSEMKAFVAGIKPQQIIPIVKRPCRTGLDGCNPRTDMTVFDKQKSEGSHIFNVPKSVQHFMSLNTWTSPGQKKRKKRSFFNNKAKKPCGIMFSSPNKKDHPVETCKSGSLSNTQSESSTLITADVSELSSPPMEDSILQDTSRCEDPEETQNRLPEDKNGVQKAHSEASVKGQYRTCKKCLKKIRKPAVKQAEVNMNKIKTPAEDMCNIKTREPEELEKEMEGHAEIENGNQTKNKGRESVKEKEVKEKEVHLNEIDKSKTLVEEEFNNREMVNHAVVENQMKYKGRIPSAKQSEVNVNKSETLVEETITNNKKPEEIDGRVMEDHAEVVNDNQEKAKGKSPAANEREVNLNEINKSRTLVGETCNIKMKPEMENQEEVVNENQKKNKLTNKGRKPASSFVSDYFSEISGKIPVVQIQESQEACAVVCMENPIKEIVTNADETNEEMPEQMEVCPTGVSEETSDTEQSKIMDESPELVSNVESNNCEHESRYCISCINQTKTFTSIYGGSCAFALDVLQKLKAKQQSK